MSHEDPKLDRLHDQVEIRAIEARYDSAWSSADMAGLMSVLEPDVVLIDPMGVASVGASTVQQSLQNFLSGAGFGSTHTSRLKRISFVSDDVALVDGEATIEGPNLSEPLVHDFTDAFVRREGQWRIAHVRAYVPVRPD